MAEVVNALPTKRFFIENIVRDITLEDAILDLVDNSVDSVIRVYDIDVSPKLLHSEVPKPEELHLDGPPLVCIEISDSRFEISDRCGGIDLDHARENVFRFGRIDTGMKSSLGVYGIGMKRAVFKIGRMIEIESRTQKAGFKVVIDVNQWAVDDSSWDLPLELLNASRSLQESGTRITISDLNEETRLRIGDGTLLKRLSNFISSTYSLFLNRFITIDLNGTRITPLPLPIGSSDHLVPGHKEIELDGVQVDLFAGLAPRIDGEWSSDRAGWFVLCNGRLVVSADKTELTGWGRPGPTFQPKHRGFVGIAFFFSNDPASLPWTTTKRGLNQESRVYQLARKEMALIARPVLSFLNDMYPSETPEEVPERDLAEKLKVMGIDDLVKTSQSTFRSPDTAEIKEKMKTVSIQYKANRSDVERIKKKENRPRWSAGRVGRHTFHYYIKMEMGE